MIRGQKRFHVRLGIAAGLISIAGVLAFLNSTLTRFVQSDRFRRELEKETAKGLHFPNGHYASIRRTGIFSAATDGFRAEHGRKAMKGLEAHGISARFNPAGVFLRRWQLDEVRIQSGEVQIQVYQATPEPTPAKPWFAIFLPDRVYLERIESEPCDVTWQFRGERSGFFGTRLLITPHGRDFNYRATGGNLRMPLIPELYLRATHVLITRNLLTLYDLDLSPDEKSEGHIHAQGQAGTRDDRSVDFSFSLERIPIRPWLPSDWREHFSGTAAGDIRWRGSNTKLENSIGMGALRIDHATIKDVPFLQRIAALAQKQDLNQLKLNPCALKCDWRYPKIELKDIAIEEKGKFSLEGKITIDRKSLGGAVELGVARAYLDWLPKPEEVFTRERRGYLWTTVHLSGTIEQPQQDLSPRIMEVFKESPGAYLGLLFRQLGAWLRKGFEE